jgi:alanyl-tRNA synthetase
MSGNSFTKRIYYDDPYKKQMKTTVKEIVQCGDLQGIILEETIFYPEGGGQPGDTGKIGEIVVVDTIEKDSYICHLTKKAIPIGSEVSIEIDWDRRFELMQAHSAQHLISAVWKDKWRYNTLSVHFSDNSTTIDINRKDLTWEQLEKLEQQVNAIIFANLPINIKWYHDEAEITNLPLRKELKKKSEEGIRIVSVEDVDYSACGGTHLHTCGEIGMVKFVKSTNIPEGSRMEYVCGWRALKLYQVLIKELTNTAHLINVQLPEVFENVTRLKTNLENAHQRIKDQEKLLATYLRQEIQTNGKLIGEGTLFTYTFHNKEITTLRDITNQILEKQPNAVIIFGNIAEEGKVTLIFARDQNFAPNQLNMGTLLRQTAKKLGGNGGGKPFFAQGGGTDKNFDVVFEEIKKEIEKIMEE